MEMSSELYCNENKENALRRRVSGNSLSMSRVYLGDITHRFVLNKGLRKSSKNVGLFALANGAKNSGEVIKSSLPR